MKKFIEKFEKTYNVKLDDFPGAFINETKLGNNYEYIANVLFKMLSIIEIIRITKDDKKKEIIEKYKEKIKEIYEYKYEEDEAHIKRDDIYRELVEELGYKELADLLEKAEDDIGFWYA